jgi:hypothetical protein
MVLAFIDEHAKYDVWGEVYLRLLAPSGVV